jgi:hypothetical protein
MGSIAQASCCHLIEKRRIIVPRPGLVDPPRYRPHAKTIIGGWLEQLQRLALLRAEVMLSRGRWHRELNLSPPPSHLLITFGERRLRLLQCIGHALIGRRDWSPRTCLRDALQEPPPGLGARLPRLTLTDGAGALLPRMPSPPTLQPPAGPADLNLCSRSVTNRNRASPLGRQR